MYAGYVSTVCNTVGEAQEKNPLGDIKVHCTLLHYSKSAVNLATLERVQPYQFFLRFLIFRVL